MQLIDFSEGLTRCSGISASFVPAVTVAFAFQSQDMPLFEKQFCQGSTPGLTVYLLVNGVTEVLLLVVSPGAGQSPAKISIQPMAA